MSEGKHGMRKVEWIGSIAASITAFAVCLAAGYGISLLIFRVTGRPAEVWTYIIVGLLGLFIFTLYVRIFFEIYNRVKHGEGFRGRMHTELMGKTLEAMNRISQGDFSVLIPLDEHDPFSELAESVNKMARELGSMESLRQDFISNVSHEIQSPLTSISGFAALLKNDALSSEQRMHYLDVIETESRRLSKLSDNLLKLSSLESGIQPLATNTFFLDKQIQNTLLMLEPQWAAKDIDLSLSLEKVSFEGDEGLLIQVWVNLLHNAIKFTPQLGQINITLSRNGSEVICRICDTGAGISAEDQIHIFERFYKADKARDRSLGGNGLGLSLVKKIVELHCGRVTVESEIGKGASFIVTLPLKK